VSVREALNALLKAAEIEGHYPQRPSQHDCAICEAMADLSDAGYYYEGSDE
jgi:hypothetical protein